MQKPLYLLKGTLYRNKNKDSDLIEIHETFTDENPIAARTKAFRMYQNYIDVMLESRGTSYKTHEQANDTMQHFINSGKSKFAFNIPELEIDTDFDKGLSIYFVPDSTNKGYTKENELIYLDKYCIHYVDNKKFNFHKHVLNSLIFEFDYYKKHNLSTDNKESWFYKKDNKEKRQKVFILDTPISKLSDL